MGTKDKSLNRNSLTLYVPNESPGERGIQPGAHAEG
jgi:hypothetical protein